MGNFVAGYYTAAIASSDIGHTPDGFEVTQDDRFDPVRVDKWGDTIVDGVYRGFNARFGFQMSEWNAAARDKLASFFESTIGTVAGVGKLVVQNSLAKALVLTPGIAGSGQFTYNAPRTAPDGERAWNLNNRLRVVRCRLIAFPNDDGVVYSRT